MILTKQYRCVHSSSCQCIKGHLSEDVIFLVFQQLNWNPKLIATLSCVCKWFDDLAKRVLWKAFCRARAPKMMLDLQSSGSHSVDGNWRALGKLLIYCSGCTKGGLFNNVHIPGHFVYRTRFSRTSGKSFLLPQCRTDVLYVSDPCEHLDQGDEGDVGFFRGIFKSFSMSKVRKMLIKRGAQLHPTEVCPYCKAKLWSMQQAEMIPQSASCRLGAYDDCIEYYVCLRCAALSVELNPGNSPRNGRSWDKFFANHLPTTIVVWAAQEAKIMLKRDLIKLMGGFKLNPKPCLDTNHASLREGRVPDVNEITSCTFRRIEEVSRDDSAYLKDSTGYKAKVTFRSISVIRRELPETELGWPLLSRTNRSALDTLRNSEVGNMSLVERNSNETKIPSNLKTDYSIVKECKIEETVIQLFHTSENRSRDGSSNGEDARFGFKQEVSSHPDHVLTKNSTRSGPGWPLLRVKTSASLESFQESQAEKFSVVQWVPSLTDLSEEATTKFQIDFVSKEVESYVQNKMRGYRDKNMGPCLAASMKLPKKMDCFFKVCTSGCKQFGYEELKRATRQFSSENFVGEGGCSNVYKGYLPGGKQVAVKILKQYKEAWSDFSLEIDIMSSLKHKHITSLIGICVEDNHLILVYDFLSQGSLDERLQGKRRKSVLPWKVRFKVAIAIAEALNHLHNECSRPVIHRDVKSSNILLSKDFQPQLSDFGLAMWGPADSAYAIHSDVVGTFGYIAPEYFMNGRVSDKIDVYSFGIVLLELLTGKKPIISKDLKGQESLIKWATPLLESGNLKALLDPKTNGKFDVVQMQRMVLAATLCVRQTARLRPKVSQILELLRGEKDEGEWVNSYANDLKKSSDEELDDLFLEFGCKPGLETSFLQLNDDDASHSSVDTASLSRVDVITPSRAGRKSRFMLRDYLKESQG